MVNFTRSSKKTRTYNMLANSAVGVLATIIQVVLNYVVRIFIVRSLGAEINGLHNLFQSIINVMAFMEAGFGAAMIVHLYKPVAFCEQKAIIEMMSFYKKVYSIMAYLFIAVGIIIDIFFIDHFVSTTISMIKVRIFFMLFVLVIAVDYFTYYKRSIVYAEQKNRISTWATLISSLIFRTLEILSAVLIHNYYVFLILMICEKICSNKICSLYVDYHYPFLRGFKPIDVRKDLRESVYKTVKPLLVYNISTTIQQSSKSILISYMLGNISIVGLFGNYQLVTGAASLLFSQFGGAYTSAIGNLAVSGNKDKLYEFYKKCTFFMNWLAILIASGIISCIQDFIFMTFGESYVLPFTCVVVLVVDMIVHLFSIPIISIQNALGLHYIDKNYMVYQAILSLPLGFFGGRMYGMNGILIGLMIPNVILTLFHKGMVIYRVAFKKNEMTYIFFVLGEIFKLLCVSVLSYIVCSMIDTGYIFWNFILKGCTSVVISLAVFILFALKKSVLVK